MTRGVAAIVALGLLAATSAGAETLDPSRFDIGQCGGIMTGFDGQQYPCEQDRKPVCELASKRCVCLERTDCGGTRNEPF